MSTRKVWYGLSIVLILISVASLSVRGTVVKARLMVAIWTL